MKIEIELRPCYAGERNGLFHLWTSREHIPAGIGVGKSTIPMGLVEFDDGKLEMVEFFKIKFIDNKHEQYVWDDKEL